jgi:hypothetical protein
MKATQHLTFDQYLALSYDRDYKHKRDQYAAVAIPEYWIVNPEDQTVLILQLQTGAYTKVGIFQGDRSGGQCSSFFSVRYAQDKFSNATNSRNGSQNTMIQLSHFP